MGSNSKDNSNLNERLSFIGLDPKARDTLRGLRPLIAKAIGPALTVFYDKVRNQPETRRFFSDDRHMAAAKGRQEEHWEIIASADYGEDYARRVRTIGETHARLGLEPRWYIGGYAIAAEQLIHSVVSEEWPSRLSLTKGRPREMAEAVSVLVKAVMLDMDLSIATYLESLEDRRRQSDEARKLAEANQAAALSALTGALEQLAAGDLTVRIDAALSAEFDDLKANFNATATKLRLAMSGVRDNASMISAGTREISTAADDLSRRTEQQAASLEETAAAVEEITTTVQKAAQGASHAQDVVTVATGDATKASDIVRKAVTAMGSIEKSSQQISQIIGVIDEIAFQTNLLALNAGVEAARAGDAGRGFAVVASEVRALAQRSAEAAKEIKELITASTSHVEEGVSLVGETGKALERIVAQVLDINNVVTAIAAGAKEQAIGLQQVNTAVSQMDQTTQQNAAMVEQTTAASHSLSEKTSELDRLIGSFNIGEPADERRPASLPRRPAKASPSARPSGARAGATATGQAQARKINPEPDAQDWKDF